MRHILTLAVIGLILGGCTVSNQVNENELDTASSDVSVKQTNDEKEDQKSLDLSSQQLEKAPEYIFDKTELISLDLSDNKLTGALPAEIRHLQNLETLDASYNRMTGVPAEIGQLSKLRVLNLSHNQLTGLPYELGNLQQLEVLDISGNNYSEQDLQIITDQLPSNTTIIK